MASKTKSFKLFFDSFRVATQKATLLMKKNRKFIKTLFPTVFDNE